MTPARSGFYRTTRTSPRDPSKPWLGIMAESTLRGFEDGESSSLYPKPWLLYGSLISGGLPTREGASSPYLCPGVVDEGTFLASEVVEGHTAPVGGQSQEADSTLAPIDDGGLPPLSVPAGCTGTDPGVASFVMCIGGEPRYLEGGLDDLHDSCPWSLGCRRSSVELSELASAAVHPDP